MLLRHECLILKQNKPMARCLASGLAVKCALRIQGGVPLSCKLFLKPIIITAPDRIMEKKTFQFTGAACL